jgi:hypothetical protein
MTHRVIRATVHSKIIKESKVWWIVRGCMLISFKLGMGAGACHEWQIA